MALEYIVAIVSLIVGIALGYYFGRYKAYQDTDISSKSAMLQSLTTQVTEMKAKFDGYEKLREQKEKNSERLSEQKEKRYQEFMESTHKFFKKQDEVRGEFEEKRDKQMGKFASVIDAFSRTIHGTKTRGIIGEDLLRQYLKESIKAGIVKTSLRTESGEVEFAWNLGDNMYIPIDAKLPDLMNLIESITEETTQAEKNKIRKKIIDKVKHEVERIKKYRNQKNTINKCILAVPESVIELAPEIIESGASKNVFVCSYKQVFLVGYILAEEYEKMKEEGDVGELKNTNKTLLGILKEIIKLTETIEKQAKSVIKHNDIIKDKIHEGLRS
jgi:DNA recombination protein RmuC